MKTIDFVKESFDDFERRNGRRPTADEEIEECARRAWKMSEVCDQADAPFENNTIPSVFGVRVLEA